MKKEREQKIRKVAVLIESSRAYGRGLIRGIGQYLDRFGNWRIEYRPRGLNEPVPSWIRSWKGHGILARINDEKMLRLLLKTGIPVVDLRRSLFSPQIPRIGPDDEAAVEMLYEHFRHRGFRRFGFVALPRGEHGSMDIRRARFTELARNGEFPISEVEVSLNEFEGNGSKGERRLIRWLRTLSDRTAILASNDDLGLQVLNACRTVGVAVPDTLAVAGIGNDECLCTLATPKLTSIDLNPAGVGFEAAVMLQEMMDDPSLRLSSRLIRPNRVIPRASTDTVAAEDAVVAATVQFIHREACNGLTVAGVLRKARLSRSTLENRFREHLGHSIFQEIVRVRLERVQELLISTDMTIREITSQTGFNYQGYLMQTFQKKFGMTMKSFRKTYRT